MFCAQCGQPVLEGAAFCPTCGRQTGIANAAAAGLPPITPTGASGPVATEKTSGLAIASLVFGILFLFPLNILAIVFGHISLSQIKQSAGRLGGRGMAIAGLVLGYMGLAMIPLILIIAAIAIPNLMRARIAANEASAIYAIRSINTAQATYSTRYETVGFAPDLQSLGGASPCTSSPAAACLIDNKLALAGTLPGQHGYVFTLARSTDASQYVVTAVPVQRHQTGSRSFCSTEDGQVRVDPNGAAISDHEGCDELSAIR